MINTLITEEQIKKVIKINNCLEPEHWNKGMYDAFMLGVGLGKCNAFDKLEKEIKDRMSMFKEKKFSREKHELLCVLELIKEARK